MSNPYGLAINGEALKAYDLVERLRPKHIADEPLARAVVSQDQVERRRAVEAYLVANNALKREAADYIAKLEAALLPFAGKMDWPLSSRDSGRKVFCELTGKGSGASFGLDADDFLTARAALTPDPS